MSVLSECANRIRRCVTTESKQCGERRDQGWSECVQERDDGYRDCCGWIPCKWFCDAWVWISHIVCLAWKWVENLICVLWVFIKAVICTIVTVATLPICLISKKLTDILDGIGDVVAGILSGIAGILLAVVEGILHAVSHPLKTFDTIINWFRGCPAVQSEAVGTQGRAKTLVIAHHGYTNVWPENTAQSCNAALRRGADALEIDLCLTADAQVILWHDWDPDDVVSLARQIGKPSGQAYYPSVPALGSGWRRPVNGLTLAEFREHYGYVNREDAAVRVANDISYGPRDTTIPTLAEFLQDVVDRRSTTLFLDIKMPGSASDSGATMIDQIYNALMAADRDISRTVLMIPDMAVLQAMKSRSQEKSYGIIFTWDIEFPAGLILDPDRFSAINHAVTPFHNSVASVGRPTSATIFPWKTYRQTIEYDIRRWNAVNADPDGENAGQLISMLITWTVDDEDELRCLIKMGVSGIITNSPELLAKLIGH
jgi:glycerophosphoryl diester phosphodiesterase